MTSVDIYFGKPYSIWLRVTIFVTLVSLSTLSFAESFQPSCRDVFAPALRDYGRFQGLPGYSSSRLNWVKHGEEEITIKPNLDGDYQVLARRGDRVREITDPENRSLLKRYFYFQTPPKDSQVVE